MPTIQQMVEGYVLAHLGAPALPVELGIQAIDYYNAMTKYFTFLPIKVIKTHNMFTGSRQHDQKISELLPTPDHFYLGVVGYAPRYQVGQYRFDEYLLGLNYSVPMYDPLKKAATDAYIDMNTGDPYFEERLDEEVPVVRWIVGGFCTLGVQYGIGHSNIEKIPRRHVELMANLVGYTYFTRLLTLRDTGNFQKSDFNIDVSKLEKARDLFKTEGEEKLRDMAPYPLTIG